MSWRSEAACLGQAELMYAGDRIAQKRRLCLSCPVRAECEAALADDERCRHDIHGFRAGLTEAERRELFGTPLPALRRKLRVLAEGGYSEVGIARALELPVHRVRSLQRGLAA